MIFRALANDMISLAVTLRITQAEAAELLTYNILEIRQMVSWKECVAYGRSVGDWPASAGSADVLQHLKKHYNLVILSNVDNQSVSSSNERLQVTFDAIYTAEDTYKPDPRTSHYMVIKLATLGVKPPEILHTAESMFHDHAPAIVAGLASAWICGRHADKGFGATMNLGTKSKYNFQSTSMADMVRAHQQQLRT